MNEPKKERQIKKTKTEEQTATEKERKKQTITGKENKKQATNNVIENSLYKVFFLILCLKNNLSYTKTKEIIF